MKPITLGIIIAACVAAAAYVAYCAYAYYGPDTKGAPTPGSTLVTSMGGQTYFATPSSTGQMQVNNSITKNPITTSNPSVALNPNGTIYYPSVLSGTTFGGPQPSQQDLNERATATG